MGIHTKNVQGGFVVLVINPLRINQVARPGLNAEYGVSRTWQPFASWHHKAT